jgi:hypothetical protein
MAGSKITEASVRVSTDQALGMIRSREPSQFGNRDKDSRPDSTYEELLVSHEIVQSAATDGEHPSGLDAPYENLFIRRYDGPTRTFTFIDVYFCH